jgi:hypothetical protein
MRTKHAPDQAEGFGETAVRSIVSGSVMPKVVWIGGKPSTW